jgi:hypothetical protein
VCLPNPRSNKWLPERRWLQGAAGRTRSSLRGASREMAESMSEDQLEEFAGTKRKNLPTKNRSR